MMACRADMPATSRHRGTMPERPSTPLRRLLGKLQRPNRAVTPSQSIPQSERPSASDARVILAPTSEPIPLDSAPPLVNDAHTVVPAESKTTSTSDSTIDNIALALNVIQQVSNIVQRVPFIGPVAAIMSEILKIYQEVNETDQTRDILFSKVAILSCDLCNTILWMEATNHVDLIGRLKADVETYAEVLQKASKLVKEYDDYGRFHRVIARKVLGGQLSDLDRELDSFGARFRTNRLVDLALNQRANTVTLDEVYYMAVQKKLEEWLSPPKMSEKHAGIQKLRTKGTGDWLLHNDKFIQWQDNAGALWIRGPSGAGKSVLSSAVISKLYEDRQLFKDVEKSPPAIAYFYFDFNDKKGQAVERALQRIVLQLSTHSPARCKALNELYMQSNGQTLPTCGDLQKVLRLLLLELDRTYIVLDALDECNDTDHNELVEVILMLQSWTQIPLHLLITSQPRNIFTDSFKGIPCITLGSELVQEDIERFIASELRNNLNLKLWIPHETYIIDEVGRRSNGMFRFAACLLLEIPRCRTPNKLHETLENLPRDLPGSYDRFLELLDPEDFIDVVRVLRWIIFSFEPVTLDKLADALAFDFSDPVQYTYDPSRREMNVGAILKWLEGLVTVHDASNDGSPIVSLAHASVQDYVLSQRFIKKFGYDLSDSLTHTFIAQTCIGYLLHFANHALDAETFPNYPLAEYAANHWCSHLLRSHDRTVLFPAAMRLLEEGSDQYTACARLHEKLNGRSDWFIATPVPPLKMCCYEGYIEGACALLANGANVNAQSEGKPSILWSASRRGDIDIVRLLLANHADVKVKDSQWGGPLVAAYYKGHAEIVHLLLANGADVNAQGREYGHALGIASRRGDIQTARLLLANGANVNAEGGVHYSALWIASNKGKTDIVGLLLENGADANTKGRERKSALRVACDEGYTEIVHLLLSNGADPNEDEQDPLLLSAAHRGHTGILTLLLENGADVDAQGGGHESALWIASRHGDLEIVRLLLENGADANIQGGEWQESALWIASVQGDIEIARLLLAQGADLNAMHDQWRSTPLQGACCQGHTEIARLLLENGADANAQGAEHESALWSASGRGDIEIVRLLLAKGADVNAVRDQRGSTPLQAACYQGHTEIVCLLLAKGADVNVQDSQWAAPLLIASNQGHAEIVGLLLANGADPNAQQDQRRRPAVVSRRFCHTRIAEARQSR
ncbi:ankyrin repeat-containing domain protein [Mycena epipterygia]|nr:ankyrin repeat-containing domain protein [Mycena epipterygia]